MKLSVDKKWIIEKTTVENIGRYNKNDFLNAFHIITNKKINDNSLKTQILINWILELTTEYDIDTNYESFQHELFNSLNKSKNLNHIWIANLVYNLISWNRNCNSCEITKQFKKLTKESNTDPLTWLSNRKILEESIKEQISIKKRKWTNSTILLIDTDNFKKVNDNYWHLVWDEVLKEFSQLFRENVRENDVIWRWWWEEFLIILPNTNIKEWKKVAEKLRQIIKEKWINNIEKIKDEITVSIWLTMIRKDDNTWAHAEDRADIALYRAKDKWRDQVCINLQNPWEETKKD